MVNVVVSGAAQGQLIQRESNLRRTHMLIYCFYKGLAEVLLVFRLFVLVESGRRRYGTVGVQVFSEG